MTITIELPSELESLLRRRAEVTGVDVSTVACAVLAENLGHELQPDRATNQRSPEEFERRLRAWIAMHPVVNHFVDDSRESIY